MQERIAQPQQNERIPIHVDVEKLMADPEFRAAQAQMHTRIAELRKTQAESLRTLHEEWDRTADPQEAKETLEFLLNALAENDY